MTLRTTDYALLSQASYQDPEVASRGPAGVEYKQVIFDGVKYKPIARADNALTGFQATAYRRLDTGEVVIAYRGTEFGREPLQDGVLADAGMVFAGVNAQTGDAMAFTRKVMGLAAADAEKYHYPLSVTVTGHSLGGTLAEITAYRCGLHGETFNSYGAAGLLEGVPAGGDQVIDHVRVPDGVSAGSRHFGQVREYATEQDIDDLRAAGYRDQGGALHLRNPLEVLARDGSGAHAIAQFTPDAQGQSLISPENEARARAHHGMIARYREDVMDLRSGLSATWELPQTALRDLERAGHATGQALIEGMHAMERGGEWLGHEIVHDAQRVGHATQSVAHGMEHAFDTLRHPGQWFGHAQTASTVPPQLDDAAHPDHMLYVQARAAVHQLDAQHQRTPDLRRDQLAAALTVAARREGFDRIGQVLLNDDASRVVVMQDPHSACSQLAHVSTLEALNTPIAKSSAAWQVMMQQQALEPLLAAPAAQPAMALGR